MALIADRSARAKFALGLVWAGAVRSGVAIAGFLATALLTRLLPTDQVGRFFIVSATALLAGPLASLSLREPTVQAIAAAVAVGDRAKAAATARSALRLGTVSALVLGAASLGVWTLAGSLGWAVAAGQRSIGFVLALWITVIAIENQLVATLQGIEDIQHAVMLDGALGKILSVFTLALLWLAGGRISLSAILFVFVTSELASTLLAAWRVRYMLRDLGPPSSAISAGELWRSTWPFLLHQITANVAAQADIMVLGIFRPAGQVALYGTATRLAALPAVPVTTLNVPIAPSVARLHALNRTAELQKLLQTSAAGFTAIAVVAAFLWATEGKFLLGTLFGPAYGGGATVLLILGVGQCLNLFFGQCMLALAMTGGQRVLTQIAVVSSFLKLGLIFCAAAPFGALGVAVAATAGNTVAMVAGWWTARRRLGIFTHAHFSGFTRALK